MTLASTPLKAFVLVNDDVTSEKATQFPPKYNQFISLLKTCSISVDVQHVLPSIDVLKEYALIFVDCAKIDGSGSIPYEIAALTNSHKVAIFNSEEEHICEKVALLAGIQGLFYEGDRADILLKGIESILSDKRWFKREVMNEAIEELMSSPHIKRPLLTQSAPDKNVLPGLTKREKTIIHLVSSGAQNKEIAEQLHISPNTVKTHIYSIFRKTSSRNRIELISWSKKFQQLS